MRSVSRSAVACVFLSALGLASGCGSSSGLGSKPTGASGTLDATTATALMGSSGGATQLVGLTNTMKADSGVTSLAGSFIGARSFPATRDCEPTLSDMVDGDSDKIPKTATATFNCSESTGGGTLTVTGSYSISDQDDAKAFPLAGLTQSADKLELAFSGGGQSASLSLSGTHALTVTGATFVQATGIHIESTIPNKKGFVEFWVDATATADTEATPKTSGKVTFKNFLVYKVESTDVTLEATATDITYAESCGSTFFKDGVISFKDGANNTITYTYTNCALTKAHNGATATR